MEKMKKKYRNQRLPIQKRSKYEKLAEQIQRLLHDRGTETFKKVQKMILEERFECREIREALKHFLSYKRGGFLIRPTLISLGCEAVGGNTKTVTEIAAPLVLMSGGMDIHDDIIDRSKTQNSSLTVFGKYDKDVALLAGDALLFKGLISWHRLIEIFPIEKFIKINRVLKRAFFELGDGQALELGLKRSVDVDPVQYLRSVKKKAADIEAIVRIGAILGDGSRDEINALSNYGRHLGMLWILEDDIADTFDDKEMLRRVKNGCLPLPVLYALKDLKVRPKLHGIFSKRKITKKEIESAHQIVLESTGLKQTKELMRTLAQNVLKSIDRFENAQKLELFLDGSLAFVSQV